MMYVGMVVALILGGRIAYVVKTTPKKGDENCEVKAMEEMDIQKMGQDMLNELNDNEDEICG